MLRPCPITADTCLVKLWPWKSSTQIDGNARPREAQRFEQPSVRCPLGEVLDMSGAGMRLRLTRKPPVISGQVLLLELVCNGSKIAVKAQVRWWRRVSLRKYELGLKFVRLTRDAAETLETIAREGRVVNAGPHDAQRPRARTRSKSAASIQVATDLPNYYGILGIRPEADAEAIHRRYRQLAARLHPDVNPDPDAQQRFERLCEAYHVLSDEKRREAYTSLVAC